MRIWTSFREIFKHLLSDFLASKWANCMQRPCRCTSIFFSCILCYFFQKNAQKCLMLIRLELSCNASLSTGQLRCSAEDASNACDTDSVFYAILEYDFYYPRQRSRSAWVDVRVCLFVRLSVCLFVCVSVCLSGA